MKFPRNHKIFRGQWDAAAFAGVFFLLVIFLVFHGSLVFTPGVPIQLPEASGLPGTTNAAITVALDAGGNLYYDNQAVTENELKTRFRAATIHRKEPLTLVVYGDKDVRYEALNRLGQMARDAGLAQLLLATRPPVAPVAKPEEPRKP